MRRDDLANETNATNVTERFLLYAANSSSSVVLNISDDQAHFADGFNFSEGGNSTFQAEHRFYNTYDPEIGINTATFLGALLLVLVVYVVYRTKCRKRILRAIHTCTMKYFPEEFTPEKRSSVVEQAEGQQATVENEWLSESAKMIWQERAKLSQEPDSAKYVAPDAVECGDGVLEVGYPDRNLELGAGEPVNVDKQVPEKDWSPRLPETEENVERATAEWVQNVKYFDRKERQLNGIILKIPPDLVSNSAKVRSHFNSVTDYCEFDEFVNISERNKSLPLLIEQQSMSQMNYASVNSVAKAPPKKLNAVAPIATQDEFELEPSPSQLKVQHSSGSKVPLDICPIVRVQHFHSRSKRRLTSINRTSSEDSTNSSDGSCPAPRTASSGVAKYIRLQTDEQGACNHKDSAEFQYKNNVQNNVQNKVPLGKIETRL